MNPILVLTLGAFVVGTELFVIAGILPALAADLGVGIPMAGQLVTVFALAYAAGAPLLATWTENVSRRKLLSASMACFAAANLLASFATSFSAMLAIRIAVALSSSLFLPSALALAARLAPDGRRGRALARVMLGLNLATILGVPAGIQIASSFGWRWIFVLEAILSLLVAVAVRLVVPETPPAPIAGFASRLAVLRRPGIARALALTSAASLSVYCVYTYLAPLVGHSAGLGSGDLSKLMFSFGAFSTLGAWVGGALSDRWGSKTILVIAIAALSLDLAAFSFLAGSFASVAGLMSVWGFFGGAFNPAQQSRLVASAPDAGAAVLAWNSSAVYLGQALAGAAGGAILELAGPGSLGWIAGGFLALAGAALLGGKRQPSCPPASVVAADARPGSDFRTP